MGRLYSGIDLHGNNNYLAVVGGNGRRVFHKRLSNGIGWVRETLSHLRKSWWGLRWNRRTIGIGWLIG